MLNRAQRRGPGRGRGRPPRWLHATGSSIWGRKTQEGRRDQQFVRLLRGEGAPFHRAFPLVASRTTSLPAAPLVRERCSRAWLQFPEGTVRVESWIDLYVTVATEYLLHPG